MGFVKTAEEVAELERYFTSPRFYLDGIRVDFTTTPEFISSILPPCLAPTGEPSGLVSIGRWQSQAAGEFDTASIYVACTDGEEEGLYNVAMIVTGDMPVSWGREVWGEAKKRGEIGYYHGESSIYAYAERHGVRLIEVEATLTCDGPGEQTSGAAYEIKAFPAALGPGFEYPPRLVKIRIRSHQPRLRIGTATLRFRGSPFDPIDTIPIVAITTATHVIDQPIYNVERVTTLDQPDAYIPYVYGRQWDDLRAYRSPHDPSGA